MANAAHPDRKRYLILKSRSLRAHLMHDVVPLSHSLTAAESAAHILGRLRQHPEWVVGAALAVVLLRPNRIGRWVRGTALGMRAWRQLLPLVTGLR